MPSRRVMPTKIDTNKILMSRGLAIVLKKSTSVVLADSRPNSRKKNRRQRKDQLIEDQRCKGCEEIVDYEFGPEVFTDWSKENEECFWNPCLVQSVKSLEYKGFVRPTTLLVGGTDYSLEVVRSAWGRRMLRPPSGYDIVMLGDLDPITMNLVAQTQFAPLPEALCKVVYDLTSEGITASMPVITKRLKTAFPEIMLPSDDILYKTLGTLIRERKLYHTGSGYSVVTPDTFRLLAMSTPMERPMLLTNEEALVRLHGVATDNGTTACTQTKQEMITTWSSAERIVEPRKQGSSLGKLKRCHSLKLLKSRDKEKLSRSNSFKSTGTSPGATLDFKGDLENIDTVKKEKMWMFSKLFRRGRSEKNRTKSKGTSSSTQFPPRDWADPDYVIFNSRATQTLEKNEDQRIKSHTRSSSLNRNSSKERHSLHLSSTPATPRIVQRNLSRQQQQPPSEVYHYRSSSLSRKASSSPKRDSTRQPITETIVPRVVNGYNSVSSRNQEQVKQRPRYESPFNPFSNREKTQPLLTASDKYSAMQNGTSSLHGKVSPYQSTDILKSPPIANKLSTFSPPTEKRDSLLGWRRPTSFVSASTTPSSTLGNSFKPPPSRIIPRFSALPRDISSLCPPRSTPLPQTTTTTSKTVNESYKMADTLSKTFPCNGKEMTLGTTVDVEISVNNNVNSQNKKTLLTTDLDSPVKNDLLKIATTWNHSIKSNTVKSEDLNKKPTGIPKLTSTTNITTSLSHGTTKDMRTKKVETTTNTVMKSTPLIKRAAAVDCNGRDSPKDTVTCSSPRSTLTSDTKSEFFSESPNTTTEVLMSKDDSGFSSSASTSRPMSVSPC